MILELLDDLAGLGADPLIGKTQTNSRLAPAWQGHAANSRPRYDHEAMRPLSPSYFLGLEMHGWDRIAYQKAMKAARPVIDQWSEWERQASSPGFV